MSGELKPSDAVVNITATVRGPDGAVKGTVELVGTTELSESEIRSAINVEENFDGCNSRNGN